MGKRLRQKTGDILRVIGKHETRKDKDAEDTIQACNHAVALWAFQLRYPEEGDWEMAELTEYRAWLAALLEGASAE